MSVLKIKKEDGTWEAIGGGSSGSSSDFLIVTAIDETTASHSFGEIENACAEGKIPILNLDGMTLEYNGGGHFGKIFAPDLSGGSLVVEVKILSDKSIIITQSTGLLAPMPTETDYGKVLSATANGLAWVTPVGGSVPSAEGVGF